MILVDVVNDGPCSVLSQSGCDVVESAIPVTDALSCAESVISHIAVCDDDHTASWVTSHSADARIVSSVVNSDAVDGVLSTAVSSSSSLLDQVVDRPSNNHYTTRLGRVIRPVHRLIESMVQIETLLGMVSNY